MANLIINNGYLCVEISHNIFFNIENVHVLLHEPQPSNPYYSTYINSTSASTSCNPIFISGYPKPQKITLNVYPPTYLHKLSQKPILTIKFPDGKESEISFERLMKLKALFE